MPSINFPARLFICSIIICCALSLGFSQDEKKVPESKTSEVLSDDEILKIGTQLIQTGVAVFDKKGQFVTNLKQEDFQLSVDGKPASISLFEESTQKNAVNQTSTKDSDAGSPTFQSNFSRSANGRNIIFVVDDFHLSFDSNYRTKKLISKFIDQEMSVADTVAIVSPSGKIGFLQQFTSDKTVLRAAVERLVFSHDRSAKDYSDPPMSEYEAQLISRFDQEVTDIFARLEIKNSPGLDIEIAREIVRSRARSILLQAAIISRGTYATLQQVVRNSAPLPGRKIVYFISDGFLLDTANSDSSYQMQRITDAAARANAVIYSFDAKGLEAGFPDGTSKSYRVQSGERFELQDGLSLLADKTGGRFIRNTNDLQTGLKNSLEEASQFYLLAWEPATENEKPEKFRKIEVSIKNRPDLKVRVQSGYLNGNLKSSVEKQNETKNERGKKNQATLPIADQQLSRAVSSQISANQLSTSLTLNHLDVAGQGAALIAVMQIKGDALEFVPQGDKAAANVDIVGVVYNSDGKREGYFRQLLTTEGKASQLAESKPSNIGYNYQLKLKPGLYQMRVAARDAKSGRVGSANQWITIPDLSNRKLALSSLILSEQKTEKQKDSEKNAVAEVGELKFPISADRRFLQTSRLRYLVFIYNAAQKSNQPDVNIQTKVFHGKETVLTSAVNPITATGQDFQRLPYIAEFPLDTFLPGQYELEVSVQDRISKTNTVQRVFFEVR